MRIAVDAMGGDQAPAVVVEGAVAAVRDFGIPVVLIGPEATVRPLAVAAAGGEAALASLDLTFCDAPEVIGMDEMPLAAVKRKRRSSIVVGLQMLKEGSVSAFFSAGNTGAIMAAATLLVGRLPGVERPALAALLPSSTGETVLLDVGANVDVKAQHLVQFAVMGSAFARAASGVDRPRVALLSVGEEEVKGNDLIRRVHQDLKRAPVHFVGNLDGKYVYSGHADVIVTDGFTGNAILKSSESLLVNLGALVRGAVERSLRARLGYLLLKPVVRALRKRVDHAEHGAVPLLGVAAPVFIGHGSSSGLSVRSAIRGAARFVERGVTDLIRSEIGQLPPMAPAEGAEPPSQATHGQASAALSAALVPPAEGS